MYTAIIRKIHASLYVGYIGNLPGVVFAAASIYEVENGLKREISYYLESNKTKRRKFLESRKQEIIELSIASGE